MHPDIAPVPNRPVLATFFVRLRWWRCRCFVILLLWGSETPFCPHRPCVDRHELCDFRDLAWITIRV